MALTCGLIIQETGNQTSGIITDPIKSRLLIIGNIVRNCALCISPLGIKLLMISLLSSRCTNNLTLAIPSSHQLTCSNSLLPVCKQKKRIYGTSLDFNCKMHKLFVG